MAPLVALHQLPQGVQLGGQGAPARRGECSAPRSWSTVAGVGGAAAEFGGHELVEVAVQDRLDVAGLHAGPVVLDHLVGVEDVGADLAAEGDVAAVAAQGGQLGLPSLRARSASRAPRILRAMVLLASWERSFWTATTIPVGRWVIRTAESVVLTPWPPGPEDR